MPAQQQASSGLVVLSGRSHPSVEEEEALHLEVEEVVGQPQEVEGVEVGLHQVDQEAEGVEVGLHQVDQEEEGEEGVEEHPYFQAKVVVEALKKMEGKEVEVEVEGEVLGLCQLLLPD